MRNITGRARTFDGTGRERFSDDRNKLTTEVSTRLPAAFLTTAVSVVGEDGADFTSFGRGDVFAEDDDGTYDTESLGVTRGMNPEVWDMANEVRTPGMGQAHQYFGPSGVAQVWDPFRTGGLAKVISLGRPWKRYGRGMKYSTPRYYDPVMTPADAETLAWSEVKFPQVLQVPVYAPLNTHKYIHDTHYAPYQDKAGNRWPINSAQQKPGFKSQNRPPYHLSTTCTIS